MRLLCAFKKYLGSRHGASAVEFAIIAPLFLFILFGLIVFGIYLGASHSVQQIAASAARASIAGLDAQERVELATAYIDENADDFPLIERDWMSVESAPHPTSPDAFIITVAYDTSHLPIWDLFPSAFDLPTTITSTSVIRDGGA